MLNEVQIAALEAVAKLADEDEDQCGEAGLYEDAETARRAAEWCRVALAKAKMDAAPPLLDRDEREMLATWRKVLP